MHFISKRAVILGVVASLGFAGVAQADTDTTSVQLTPGEIGFNPAPAFANFGATALTGVAADAVPAAINEWGVNDARGTGLGYSVTMSASALVDPGPDLDPQTAPDNITMSGAVLTVTDPEPAAAPGNTSTAPTTNGGIISGASPAIVTAAADQGLGAWTFLDTTTPAVADLALQVPANARVGTYASTITSTLTPVTI